MDVDADFSVNGKGTRARRQNGAVRTDHGDQNGLRDLPRRQKATPRSDAVVRRVSSPSVHVLSEGARTDVGIPRAVVLEPEMVVSNTAHQHIKLEDEPPSSGRRVLLGSDRAAGPPGAAKKKKKTGGAEVGAQEGSRKGWGADKAQTQKKWEARSAGTQRAGALTVRGPKFRALFSLHAPGNPQNDSREAQTRTLGGPWP